MDLFFNAFLKERVRDFRRISRQTKGEMSVEDLQTEAWLMARKIGQRQQRQFDLSNPDDQDYVLGALVNEFIKWRNPILWLSRSLDREYEYDDGDSGNALVDRLAALDTSDPLALLALREALAEDEYALTSSYSQAAAWVIVLAHFDHDRERICAWLVIADSTLTGRIRRSLATVQMQPSLFDRIEIIDEDFMPLRGRECMRPAVVENTAGQFGFCF